MAFFISASSLLLILKSCLSPYYIGEFAMGGIADEAIVQNEMMSHLVSKHVYIILP